MARNARNGKSKWRRQEEGRMQGGNVSCNISVTAHASTSWEHIILMHPSLAPNGLQGNTGFEWGCNLALSCFEHYIRHPQ
eukprot:1147947-Pelagomonas_calceolata.AAC.8